MIDVILFFLGFAAMRLSFPLGIALVFLSFHVPGWVIASGNPAAIWVVVLAVAELVLRITGPDPGMPLTGGAAVRGLARAAALLAMGAVIYAVGIGRPYGPEVAQEMGGAPGGIGTSELGRQVAAMVGSIVATAVSLFGQGVWLVGSVSCVVYGAYIGFDYVRGWIATRRTLGAIAAAASTQAQPGPPSPSEAPPVVPQPPPSSAPASGPPAPQLYVRPLDVQGPPPPEPPDAIIDGSNMAHLGDPVPTLARVAVVARRLEEMGLRWLVVFDASLKHELPEGVLPAEHAQVLTGVGQPMTEHEALLRAMLSGRAHQVPARTSADRFILRMARRWNAIVVSNDTFSEHLEEFPEAQQRRVTCMVVAGEVFFEPDPVEALRRIREAGEVRGERPPGYVG
ncbi:MAG: hypothetical protein QXP81_09080 [Nitrososphaerota archaeon]